MNIGIIDADLLDRGTRHPNLALMKISGYYKGLGHSVKLVESYDVFEDFESFSKPSVFDKVFLSKVFTSTEVPNYIFNLKNIEIGGSGIYWNNKEKYLSEDIEHHMPDYSLYDNYIEKQPNKQLFKDYKDKSIGFLTRGCIRKCAFCINANCDKIIAHSPLAEFYDETKKHIYLLDDNFLGYKDWERLLDDLDSTGKPFQFRQGLDIRLLTEAKTKRLGKSKYYGDYIFAFDNIEDREIIERKLHLWRTFVDKKTKLYVLCGFDHNNKWDKDFWKQDIIDTFERIKILMKWECYPYIMRFNRCQESPYKGTYINLAAWCNQPALFNKKSYKEFCLASQERIKGNSSCVKYMNKAASEIPSLEEKYYDLRYRGT